MSRVRFRSTDTKQLLGPATDEDFVLKHHAEQASGIGVAVNRMVASQGDGLRLFAPNDPENEGETVELY